MTQLLHDLPLRSAERSAHAPALRFRTSEIDYGALAASIEGFAGGLIRARIGRAARIAIYLPKTPEAVAAMFGSSAAGCVFVPVNSLLKGPQVAHIVNDCAAQVFVTAPERLADLESALTQCASIRLIVVTGAVPASKPAGVDCVSWSEFVSGGRANGHRVVDADMVSILYTSGSTGKPKGVVLSHKNMVTGAVSVASYLTNTPDDRLLAVLPFSFDYGFSQLSTAFHVGASVSLMDYLFARDILKLLAKDRITGLAGVPPLWAQLADLEWPAGVDDHLRYITNSGGAMPTATLNKLRKASPKTRPFLMYGLTEAFRSTYLDPSEIDRRPESIGKAIPNAEILVVRPDGTECAPDEPGELVHRGTLVALGYWNDPAKTAERYKPVPGQDPGLVLTELAVWSGDTVRRDAEGFLYFVGRRDEMIKTSGYRVSPSEVEEGVYASGLVADAVAVGVPHATLGAAIVIVASAAPGVTPDAQMLIDECKRRLPNYMVPQFVEWRDELPRNPNGKFDRPLLASQCRERYKA
jgi:acyl-CoA ligase (AMP-forming) (exosortase A-associated)